MPVKKMTWFVIFVSVMTTLSAVEMDWGRYYPKTYEKDKDSFTFTLNYGWLTDFKGEVLETKRAGDDYYERRNEYEHYLEYYTFEDLGFDDKYAIYGFQMEKRWKYISLAMDFGYFNPKAEAVADREEYAIAMEEIEYNGQTYEYMLIPKGQSFSTDIDGAILELNSYITPFSLQMTDAVHFTPWINLGIYSVAGKFKIDAGEPQGITNYEYHPYDYVIGGKGEGWFGAGMPEIGFGGECVFEFLTRNNTEYNFVFQFNIVNYSWEGSTGDFGILNVRHEKDIDLSYTNNEFKFYWEFPIFESSSFLAGIKYQIVSADATIEASDKSEQEEEALKEKYDKEISTDITNLSFFISIRT